MARILLSGASGLIGSALRARLGSLQHEVIRLVRRPADTAEELEWDPAKAVAPGLVSGFDAVINLSGETIAARWTSRRRQRIHDSRVTTTENLARALAAAENRPSVFISASAIGYYGDRSSELLTEESPPGSGFLAAVCRDWESAAQNAATAGIRTICLRIGVVLSAQGGALKPMLLPFRLGLGGRIGSGSQWWSWIHVHDLASAVIHVLGQSTSEERTPVPVQLIRGPVNLVSPHPVTNAEFTRALAASLRRPAVLPLPGFAARLALGEFARDGLLASTRAAPKKLTESGFQFRYPELGSALNHLLARDSAQHQRDLTHCE